METLVVCSARYYSKLGARAVTAKPQLAEAMAEPAPPVCRYSSGTVGLQDRIELTVKEHVRSTSTSRLLLVTCSIISVRRSSLLGYVHSEPSDVSFLNYALLGRFIVGPYSH